MPGTRPTDLLLAQSLQQVVAHADRIGDCGKGRIHRSDTDEETCVDNVQVIELMRLAVHVERRRLRVMTEPDRAVLVRNAGQGNALAQI